MHACMHEKKPATHAHHNRSNNSRGNFLCTAVVYCKELKGAHAWYLPETWIIEYLPGIHTSMVCPPLTQACTAVMLLTPDKCKEIHGETRLALLRDEYSMTCTRVVPPLAEYRCLGWAFVPLCWTKTCTVTSFLKINKRYSTHNNNVSNHELNRPQMK